MDYIYFGVGHFKFIQGYIIQKISSFFGRFGNRTSITSQMSFVKAKRGCLQAARAAGHTVLLANLCWSVQSLTKDFRIDLLGVGINKKYRSWTLGLV